MKEPDTAQKTAHRDWVQSIADARRETRKHLVQIERAQSPSKGPFIHPETPHGMKRARQDLHSVLLDYRSNVAPFRDRVPELWKQEIDTVQYPKEPDGELTLGDRILETESVSSIGFEKVLPEVEWGIAPVTLENIPDFWQMREFKVDVHVHQRFNGYQLSEWRERVWIPPSTARKAFDQLNDILDHLGLTAEIKKPDHTAGEA
jgi:hypothetical protein